jgi:hypothetical protein
MAKMLALVQRDKTRRCCDNCVFRDGRYRHGGKNPLFRKWARAGDKAAWRRSDGQ